MDESATEPKPEVVWYSPRTREMRDKLAELELTNARLWPRLVAACCVLEGLLAERGQLYPRAPLNHHYTL